MAIKFTGKDQPKAAPVATKAPESRRRPGRRRSRRTKRLMAPTCSTPRPRRRASASPTAFADSLAGSAHRRPGVGQPVACRPRIVGIEHHLMRAGDPGAAGDRRDDAGRPATVVSRSIRPIEARADDRAPMKLSPTFSSPRACITAMRAEIAVPVGERSILPGSDRDGDARHRDRRPRCRPARRTRRRRCGPSRRSRDG